MQTVAILKAAFDFSDTKFMTSFSCSQLSPRQHCIFWFQVTYNNIAQAPDFIAKNQEVKQKCLKQKKSHSEQVKRMFEIATNSSSQAKASETKRLERVR